MKRVKLRGGQTLVIDAANPRDAAEILQFLNVAAGESDNLSSGPGDFSQSVEAERSYLQQQAASRDSVTLCGKVDGRVMAIGALYTPRLARIAHTSELSVLVGRPFWSLGVGDALITRLTDFAAATGTIRLIHLRVRADNAPAVALYRKHGFQSTGLFERYLKVDGVYHDELIMSLWLDLKK